LLFNTLSFFLFFAVVFLVHYSIPKSFRVIFLLLASYFFYMCWRPEYIVLILFSTVVDYICSRGIDSHRGNRFKQKMFLAVSIVSNLGLLGYFKYTHFLVGVFNDLNSSGFSVEQIILPVGISFYTFQTLGHTIDVYRGDIRAEKNFFKFSLFVSYFPQLVAGPIERAKNLLPQISHQKELDPLQIRRGLIRFGWGLFKKVVIADRLVSFIDPVYQNPEGFSAFSLYMVTLMFAFQIYCDFSGYSDMAIGIARCLGVNLMDNFKRPYFSKSVSEFWGRWHMSLSFWFRDYLYIPLGGNKKGEWRRDANLMATFLVSGLWHGASWNFIVWGGINGLFVAGGNVLKRYWPKSVSINWPFRNLMKAFITFHLICSSWIYFRAQDITTANYILKKIISMDFFTSLSLILKNRSHDLFINQRASEFQIAIGAIVFMELVHLWERKRPLEDSILLMERPYRWTFYIFMMLAIINLGRAVHVPFIYFQF